METQHGLEGEGLCRGSHSTVTEYLSKKGFTMKMNLL